jgi:tRNA threonylcarbamoyladenosine biosynthesis protein TsaE
MILEVNNEIDMKQFGTKLGELLMGGEVIELIGDVGAGKTTLAKGIGAGLRIDEDIQSPSFTISRIYSARNGLSLAHYDFYRLHDAGIMAGELHETLRGSKTITIVEWADVVSGVLPEDRVSIYITPTSEAARKVELKAGGNKAIALLKKLA